MIIVVIVLNLVSKRDKLLKWWRIVKKVVSRINEMYVWWVKGLFKWEDKRECIYFKFEFLYEMKIIVDIGKV